MPRRNTQATAHPIVAVLAEELLSQRWLARTAGYNHVHAHRAIQGRIPASAAFRAACALALGQPEAELFHGTPPPGRPARWRDKEGLEKAG